MRRVKYIKGTLKTNQRCYRAVESAVIQVYMQLYPVLK